MSPRRWIIVATRVSREDALAGRWFRYLGSRGWGFTVIEAKPFDSREDADAALSKFDGCPPDRLVIRPVRTRAAAQAAEDNAATMRAELDGLRATDEEMAAKLAAVTAERDAAVRDLAELRRAIEVLIAQARPAA